MPDLIEIYERSNKPRPTQAKQIPDQKTNFLDIEKTFTNQFSTFPELRQTTYTDRSLGYYSEERDGIVIPESFNPVEELIQLNRYAPREGYYRPGSAPGFG